MLQLQDIVQLISSDVTTSQTGIKLWSLLLPGNMFIQPEHFNLIRYEEFVKAESINQLFEKAISAKFSHRYFIDYVLVTYAGSNFFNTDHVALSQIRKVSDDWRIDVNVTHTINPNGEPKPCSLYLFSNFANAEKVSENVVLRIEENWQDFAGKAIPAKHTFSTITIKINQ